MARRGCTWELDDGDPCGRRRMVGSEYCELHNPAILPGEIDTSPETRLKPGRPPKAHVCITMRLRADLAEALAFYAARTGQPKTRIVEDALGRYLPAPPRTHIDAHGTRWEYEWVPGNGPVVRMQVGEHLCPVVPGIDGLPEAVWYEGVRPIPVHTLTDEEAATYQQLRAEMEAPLPPPRE